MRHLASYTIGKRQYLTEINKKMAVIYLATEQGFANLENKMKIIEQNTQKDSSFSIIKDLK